MPRFAGTVLQRFAVCSHRQKHNQFSGRRPASVLTCPWRFSAGAWPPLALGLCVSDSEMGDCLSFPPSPRSWGPFCRMYFYYRWRPASAELLPVLSLRVAHVAPIRPKSSGRVAVHLFMSHKFDVCASMLGGKAGGRGYALGCAVLRLNRLHTECIHDEALMVVTCCAVQPAGQGSKS